jgi:O-Antigen ligase
MITGETDQSSVSRNVQPYLTDDDLARLAAPGRWLPDWLMLRIPRFHLPAPLAMAIMAAALLGALITPRLAMNQRTGMVIAAAILGLAGILMVIKWRILGLMALPIVSLMVPFAIGTGSQTGINAAVLWLGMLLGLWLLDMIARKRQIRLSPYRPVIVSLIFGVVVVLAFGFGQLPWFATRSATLSAQIGGLLIFLMSIGAFLLVAHQIRTTAELKWMILVFLGVGFVFFTIRLFPITIAKPIIDKIFVRQAVLGAAFYVWLIAIAASQALYNRELPRVWRIVLVVLVLMFFYVTMKADERSWVSGWLPSLAVLFTVILLGRPKWGVFMVIIGCLILILNTGVITGLFVEGDNTYSTISRLAAWKIMAEIIKVNPIFGLGMANYYWYTPLFPIMGYKINFNSHNNYIDLIAQTGLVGLFCYLWFMGELSFLGWRMRLQVPDGFPRAYVIGALGGLVGTLVLAMLGDWVIPFVYNIGMEGFRSSMYPFLFLGGLVALARIYNISPTRNIEAPSR